MTKRIQKLFKSASLRKKKANFAVTVTGAFYLYLPSVYSMQTPHKSIEEQKIISCDDYAERCHLGDKKMVGMILNRCININDLTISFGYNLLYCDEKVCGECRVNSCVLRRASSFIQDKWSKRNDLPCLRYQHATVNNGRFILPENVKK